MLWRLAMLWQRSGNALTLERHSYTLPHALKLLSLERASRSFAKTGLIEFPLAGGAPPPLVLELGVWLLALVSCYVLGDSGLSVSRGAAECCQRQESDFRGPV